MQRNISSTLPHVLAFLAVLLIAKVTLSIVFEYRNYIPPNFGSDFLRGREAYFWGAYGWAFYTHLASGPASLMLGTLLVSDRFRRSYSAWHRRLGRVQAACVLLLVAPSGLWMAYYAATGAVAAAGLGSLAIATASCVAFGWRSAVVRRFADHRLWMWRTFVLLCSAVVLRLIGGLATVAQFDALWLYPLSTWASWLVPLLVLEASRLMVPPARVLNGGNAARSPQMSPRRGLNESAHGNALGNGDNRI
ncbi:MAG: DUF2306 domain-containing protein [Pirellulaceae bacterium]|nr:DUF2306 domain-containing protein [Pirellulaceae bacterium]